MRIPSLLAIALTVAACSDAGAPPPSSTNAPAQTATAPLAVTSWDLPVGATAAQPDLVAAPDGTLLLSWIEPQASGHVLKFARFDGKGWSSPQPIASGTDWFVNWADTPHVAATADGALWAHWLQKTAEATYAYDVVMSRSGDGGKTWSAPVRINTDGRPAEHGFVSLWPAADDRIGVAWLDGRDAAVAGDASADAGHAGHGGAMTLRAATFDAGLQRLDETRIDAMTCDCCQTDVAISSRGPVLVWRDRTPEEIRDIAVARYDGAAWTAPRLVHADQWTMPACPVNGPSVAANGTALAVGWYTAAGGVPTLKLARSADAGDRFDAPVVLDSGEAVQGRIDVALDGDAAWALWLREDGRGQSVQLARHAGDLAGEPQRIEVARLQGRGRGTGFPQLAVQAGTAHVVWTDVVDGKPRLHGAVLSR